MSEKNCINCTFCCRLQDTFISYPAMLNIPSKWKFEVVSLNQNERSELMKGNMSFLGAEILAAQEWDAEIEEKMRKKPASFSNLLGHGYTEDEIKECGMSERPNAPTYDYLGCFKEQWKEDQKRLEVKVSPEFLKKHKCPFYFPFTKMGRRSLEACEDLQNFELNRKRYRITNAWVITGIVVTLAVGILTLLHT